MLTTGLEQNLDAKSRDEVQQLLIEKFDCRVKIVVCDRIFKLRQCKDTDAPPEMLSRTTPLPPKLPSIGDPSRVDAVVAITSRFIHVCCA